MFGCDAGEMNGLEQTIVFDGELGARLHGDERAVSSPVGTMFSGTEVKLCTAWNGIEGRGFSFSILARRLRA